MVPSDLFNRLTFQNLKVTVISAVISMFISLCYTLYPRIKPQGFFAKWISGCGLIQGKGGFLKGGGLLNFKIDIRNCQDNLTDEIRYHS